MMLRKTTLYVGGLVVQINWDSILTDDTELLDAAIGQLLKRGVEARLIHAKEPGMAKRVDMKSAQNL